MMPQVGAAKVRDLFQSHFGSQPEAIAIAPGRVNLIGEHTDYNEGFVFPAAIDRTIFVAASRCDGKTEAVSAETGPGNPFDALSAPPRSVEGWAAYPAGMAWALREAGNPVSNLRAAVLSDIPIGSGVSSSAAIEMAFGVLWREFGGLQIDQAQLAKLGQMCENRFVGVNSGIMDQMASALGQEGKAIFLDTRSLEAEFAPIPAGLSIVLCDTKKERALTTSAYNERRSQCEEAARVLGVGALRDATMDELMSKREEMDGTVFRRARHVITENARAQSFKIALDKGDRKAIGDLMRESHQSLRFDYEVSCSELDWMAEAAWAAPGCVGARMTGAGFGGACVALVESAAAPEFIDATLKGYVSSGGLAGAEALPCRAVDGARLLEG